MKLSSVRKRVSVFYVFLLFILLTIRLSAAGTTPVAKPGIAKPGLNKPKPASGTVLLKPKPASGTVQLKPNSPKPGSGTVAKPKPKPVNTKPQTASGTVSLKPKPNAGGSTTTPKPTTNKPKPTSGSSKPNTSSKPNAGVAAPKPNKPKPKPSNTVKPKPETNKPENGTAPKESNKPPELNDYPKGTRLSCKIKYSIVFPDGKSEGGEEIIQGDISIIIPPLTPANMQSPYIVTGFREARKQVWRKWRNRVNKLEKQYSKKLDRVFIQSTEYWTDKNPDIKKVTAYIRYYVVPTEGAHTNVDLPPTGFGIEPTEFLLDQAF